MSEMTKQQFCAALGISESTVRRLEDLGLPFTPVGKRSHRYDLEECKAWLKANPPGATTTLRSPAGWTSSKDFIEASKRQRRRVEPS